MEKLCKLQLIDGLVTLFENSDPEIIDNAIARAKNFLAEKRKKDFEYLFDNYLHRLEIRHCPKKILEAANECKKSVIARAKIMIVPEGHIPFVGPIIRPEFIDYDSLMSMVRNGNNKGRILLEPTLIADKVLTPFGLYWLYDVEDGEIMRGESPRDAEKFFETEGRSGFTAAEAINFCILTDTLSKHSVDAIASRYGNEAPCIYVDTDGPRLRSYSLDVGSSLWGAPSCNGRRNVE